MRSSSRPVGAACVLAAAALWGTLGTAATFATDLSPMAVGSVSFGLGGLLLAAVFARAIRAAWPVLRGHRGIVLIGVLAVAAHPVAYYAGMQLVGVAVGTVVAIGSAPLIAAIIERAADGARLSRRWLGATMIGLVGIILLCAARAGDDGAVTGAGNQAPAIVDTVLGVVIAIVAGATYAVYSWAARRLIMAGADSQAAMGACMGGGGVLLLPVLALCGGAVVQSWNNVAVTGYLALVPFFLAYIFFAAGLARVAASMATTLTLLEPMLATVLAVVVVHEVVPPLGWVGMGLIGLCLTVLVAPRRAPAEVISPELERRTKVGRSLD